MARDDRPLPAHLFHMLMALADGDRHGLAIMQAVLEQTQGRIRLWPAMLYRNLDRLVQAGLIVERPQAETTIPGSPRFFHLTARGRRACAAEAKRLAGVVELARAKRLLGGEK
jgi:DNA-binding PadR family transcriptional regulator